MNMGADASFCVALTTFGQRSGLTRPLRRSSPSSLACDAMKRCASSVSDISSENSATGLPWSTAAFSAMFVTNALLPMLGRAAITIRLPGWRPPVSSSMSVKPVGVPVIAIPWREIASSLSSSSCSTSSIERTSPACSSCAIRNSLDSACSSSSRGSPENENTCSWMSRASSRRFRSMACSLTIFA